jgi:hypothetical protein
MHTTTPNSMICKEIKMVQLQGIYNRSKPSNFNSLDDGAII